MRKLSYDNYEIEIFNEPTYKIGSADNNFNYDFIYHDTDSLNYISSNHGLKLYKDEQLIKSAIVCASAGGTGISDKSVIIVQNNIMICCANKLYCLNLPDFKLNWVTQTDHSTCLAVYKADNGIFTHGELEISRLDVKGNIIWQTVLRDIIINIENEKDCFIIRENYIELQDFKSNIYHLDFDGNFIKDILKGS